MTAAAQKSNQVHVLASSSKEAQGVAKIIFDSAQSKSSAKVSKGRSTLVVVKPHSISEGTHHEILKRIVDHHFMVTCVQQFQLQPKQAQQFMSVYKTVVPEYRDLTHQLFSGTIIAMEIYDSARDDDTNNNNNKENSNRSISTSSDVVQQVREFMGCHDPNVAKHIQGNTVRALFGTTRVKNAVHCTDLSDDGILEVQYFFDILQSTQ